MYLLLSRKDSDTAVKFLQCCLWWDSWIWTIKTIRFINIFLCSIYVQDGTIIRGQNEISHPTTGPLEIINKVRLVWSQLNFTVKYISNYNICLVINMLSKGQQPLIKLWWCFIEMLLVLVIWDFNSWKHCSTEFI